MGVTTQPRNPIRDGPTGDEAVARAGFRVVDAIREHFRTAERAVITLPEWTMPDGSPVTFYFRRISVEEFNAVLDREPKNFLERNLLLLIAKAEDVDGKPVFASGDIHMLRSAADMGCLTRLIDFMLLHLMDTKKAVAVAKEELGETATSASSSS